MSSSEGIKPCLAIDYGSYAVKYGVEDDAEPKMIRTAGLVIPRRIIENLLRKADDIIIGDDIDLYVAGIRIIKKIIKRLHYPVKHGIIKEDDQRDWRILERITEQILLSIYARIPPTIEEDFDGFYIVFSLNAIAPRYMYEGFFKIFRRFAEYELVKAVTVLQQPLATAIASGRLTCVVVESGHSNTQIVPITERVIRSAIVPLNMGGVNADALTKEILKDAGYGDIASDDEIVRQVKETIGAIPIDLDRAIEWAKRNPERARAKIRLYESAVGGEIDLARYSWKRFLIGEFIFNPEHEIFHSYYRRGFPKPRETSIGDTIFYGSMPLDEAIIESLRRCDPRTQERIFEKGVIILSGGNMAWRIPRGLEEVAVTADQKISYLLRKKGLRINAELAPNPLTTVWEGCLLYGQNLPLDMKWNWNTLDGWMTF
ncbi:MAG: hypothetical protein J7L79_05645 [Thaumarchaeota archaeon]|nr:hypothetical protein [Nitrososphaerota archaeon]